MDKVTDINWSYRAIDMIIRIVTDVDMTVNLVKNGNNFRLYVGIDTSKKIERTFPLAYGNEIVTRYGVKVKHFMSKENGKNIANYIF